MDVKKLKERDRNVLYLIESRFLMAVGKSYIYETHQCEVQCEKQIFSMVLRRVKQKGFKSIEKKMLLFFGKKPQTEADDFPEIHLMEETEPCEADVREKWTQPPKQFPEDYPAGCNRTGRKSVNWRRRVREREWVLGNRSRNH